jgi:hypothetical protein
VIPKVQTTSKEHRETQSTRSGKDTGPERNTRIYITKGQGPRPADTADLGNITRRASDNLRRKESLEASQSVSRRKYPPPLPKEDKITSIKCKRSTTKNKVEMDKP